MSKELQIRNSTVDFLVFTRDAGDTETKLTDLLGDMFKTNYYRGCYDIQSIMGVGFTVAKVDEKLRS